MSRSFVFRRATFVAMALSVGVLVPSPGSAADVTPTAVAPSLELLFELDLTTEGEIKPYVEAEEVLDRGFSMSRDLVAQGEGRVTGRWLEGGFRWSLLGRKYPGQPFGRVHLTGWLESDDGAEIFLRATGYTHDDDSRISTATLFSISGGFEVELEPDYEWLNGIVVLIEGTLDPETNTFHYRAWVPSEVLGRRAPTE